MEKQKYQTYLLFRKRQLGKYVELTVVYEAMGASNQGIRFNWDNEQVYNYRAIFLNEG